MSDDLPISKTLRIRDCGFDEYWLQDQVAGNPACLKLGELDVLARERRHSGGGRLDILLKDPEDDSMYEVELMLGETDETHIIRTIEYWAREKRKWPQRQHFPVIVAERITRRFFEVIQVLSNSIPLIAIQVSVEEANGQRLLAFHKILDVYEEPEDSEPAGDEVHDEAYWNEMAPWTAAAAKALLGIVRPVFPDASLNYVKSHLGVWVNGNNLLWFKRRAAGKSQLGFWVGERLINTVKPLLDEKRISYSVKQNQSIRIVVDEALLQQNADLFRKLAGYVKQAWTE